MTVRLATLLSGALIASGCAHRQAMTASDLCPSALPGQAEAAAMGFRAMADTDPPRPTMIVPGTASALATVRFSDGPPEEQAWLAPSEERNEESIWRFVPTAERQTHLTCSYGPDAPMLSRPLSARTCTARFDASDAVTSLSCN